MLIELAVTSEVVEGTAVAVFSLEDGGGTTLLTLDSTVLTVVSTELAGTLSEVMVVDGTGKDIGTVAEVVETNGMDDTEAIPLVVPTEELPLAVGQVVSVTVMVVNSVSGVSC